LTVSYINLVGTREAPDKTVRYRLQTHWTAANITGTITPTFQSSYEEPDSVITDDFTDQDNIGVTWLLDQRIEDSENEPNGDSIHHFKHIIRIDVWAQDMLRLNEICDEINRILWEYSPNSGTRFLKSDETASEADYFEKTEISFEQVEPESRGSINFKPSTTAILEIHYRKAKS
jgi:hypothetical protein